MKRAGVLVLGLVILSTSAISVAATAADRSSKSGGAVMKVGMALTGPKNDKGYNQGYYEGLLAAQKVFKLKIEVVDNANTPQLYLDSLRNLARDNQVVFGIGAEFGDPALTIGPQFPKVTFLAVNGKMSKKAPNVFAYFVRQGVPAFPGGAIAAKLTKTKKIGFIGGTEIPPTFGSKLAFAAGAQYVDPKIKELSAIVGSFNDPSKAKQAARAQLAAGADVIYAFLDGTAVTAVAEAIKESGKKATMMTPIFARCSEFSGVDYGTAYLSASAQVVSMMRDVVTHRLPTTPKFYGIEDPKIQRFDLCPKFRTPAFQKIVVQTSAGINSGKIKLPKGV
jgi:basic membrane protein A